MNAEFAALGAALTTLLLVPLVVIRAWDLVKALI